MRQIFAGNAEIDKCLIGAFLLRVDLQNRNAHICQRPADVESPESPESPGSWVSAGGVPPSDAAEPAESPPQAARLRAIARVRSSASKFFFNISNLLMYVVCAVSPGL